MEGESKPMSERSTVQLGLVFSLAIGVAWCLVRWTDVSDKYQTKELAAAQMQVVAARFDSQQAELQALEKSLSGQLEALRAEVRASDGRGK